MKNYYCHLKNLFRLFTVKPKKDRDRESSEPLGIGRTWKKSGGLEPIPMTYCHRIVENLMNKMIPIMTIFKLISIGGISDAKLIFCQ